MLAIVVRVVDGKGFAFVPRNVVLQPKAFGLIPDLLVPRGGEKYSSERYRAAMMQHIMCFSARTEIMRVSGTSPGLYAKKLKLYALGEDRTRRIFRGATMAQFADFAFWTTTFPDVGRIVFEYVASWSVPPASVDARVSSPEVEISADPRLSPYSEPAAPLAPAAIRNLEQQFGAKRTRTTSQNPYG